MDYSYPFPHPAIAADIAVLGLNEGVLSVLLIERGEEPNRGAWALPGGFLRPDETVEACAVRELQEETGVRAEVDLVGVFSAPDRDPRERFVSVAWLACVDHAATRLRAGTDAAGARWVAAKTPRRAVQLARLDVMHQGGKVKLHVQRLRQVVDQRRNRFA